MSYIDWSDACLLLCFRRKARCLLLLLRVINYFIDLIDQLPAVLYFFDSICVLIECLAEEVVVLLELRALRPLDELRSDVVAVAVEHEFFEQSVLLCRTPFVAEHHEHFLQVFSLYILQRRLDDSGAELLLAEHAHVLDDVVVEA